MEINRFVYAAAFCGFLAIATSGCGGGGGGDNDSQNSGAYAATYYGEYISGTDPGPIQFTVDRKGMVNGTATLKGAIEPVTGTITSSGNLSLSITSVPGTSTGNLTSPVGTGTVNATLINSSAGTGYIVLLVNPAPGATGGSPFAGDYYGTDTDTTQNLVGPMAFTIDSSGNISGTVLVPLGNDLWNPVQITGSITTSGTLSFSQANNSSNKALGSATLGPGPHLSGSYTSAGSNTDSFTFSLNLAS